MPLEICNEIFTRIINM